MLVQLAGFNFTVTDSVTGLPIEGAHCILYAALNNTGDAVAAYTDSQGIASLDAEWFVPRSWRVTKEGYIAQWGNSVLYETIVSLEPTEIIYTVNVLSGVGGYTVPSGFLDILPNTELLVTAYPDAGYILDYWVNKGQIAGNTNPTKFTIDRDAITISAVFKVSEVPPPPPDGAWPVSRQIHTFDNYLLTANATDFPQKAEMRPLKNVDMNVFAGAKLEYTITYVQGNDTLLPHAGVTVNGIVLVDEAFDIGQTKSGSIDISAHIKNSNEIVIGFGTMIGMWEQFSFDVWITLGFSSEPATEPEVTDPKPWENWQWYQWLALGGGAFLLLYLLMGRQPSVIVVRGD